MSRALLVLHTPLIRAKASHWITIAPQETRVEFKGPKRTLPQNDRMWAMLTDVSEQRLHHGIRLSPADWKKLFTASLKRELRLVPNLDGDGFVQLGDGTSDLSILEMRELIEFLFSWGAQNGVLWSDPQERAA